MDVYTWTDSVYVYVSVNKLTWCGEPAGRFFSVAVRNRDTICQSRWSLKGLPVCRTRGGRMLESCVLLDMICMSQTVCIISLCIFDRVLSKHVKLVDEPYST